MQPILQRPLPLPIRDLHHPDVATFLNRELLEELDDFGKNDERLLSREFQGRHYGSYPVLMSGQSLLNQPSTNTAMVRNLMPNGVVNRQMAKAITTLRSYSYEIDRSINAGMYPRIQQDLQILSTVVGMQDALNIKPLASSLVQRTPTEIDTLRNLFHLTNSGTDLDMAFNHALEGQPKSVKYAIMGLALGPVLFDSWLLQILERGHEDVLIDIFVGRRTEVIRFLLFKVQQQAATTGRTMSEILDAATSDDVLRRALSITIERTRPDSMYPLDQSLDLSPMLLVPMHPTYPCCKGFSHCFSIHPFRFDYVLQRHYVPVCGICG